MVEMLKKSSLLSKIAMIVSILSMIVAISNIFVQSEKLRVIVWCLVVIVWCLVVIVLSLDCWSTVNENFKLLKKHTVLTEAYIRAVAAFGHIEIQIDCMDLPEEAKEQLKDLVESEFEEVKHIREGAES